MATIHAGGGKGNAHKLGAVAPRPRATPFRPGIREKALQRAMENYHGISVPVGVFLPVNCPSVPPKLRSLPPPQPDMKVMSLGRSVAGIRTYKVLPSGVVVLWKPRARYVASSKRLAGTTWAEPFSQTFTPGPGSDFAAAHAVAPRVQKNNKRMVFVRMTNLHDVLAPAGGGEGRVPARQTAAPGKEGRTAGRFFTCARISQRPDQAKTSSPSASSTLMCWPSRMTPAMMFLASGVSTCC